jgi:fibronectin type III domain protein
MTALATIVCFHRSIARAETIAAPTNLSVMRYRPHVLLRWEHDGRAIKGFEIERASTADPFTRVGVVGREVRTFRDSGTRPGMSYVYRVRAVSAADASPYSDELLVKLNRSTWWR